MKLHKHTRRPKKPAAIYNQWFPKDPPGRPDIRHLENQEKNNILDCADQLQMHSSFIGQSVMSYAVAFRTPIRMSSDSGQNGLPMHLKESVI
jgi:hypothetical protein